jgi:MAC/Perforin domain
MPLKLTRRAALIGNGVLGANVLLGCSSSSQADPAVPDMEALKDLAAPVPALPAVVALGQGFLPNTGLLGRVVALGFDVPHVTWSDPEIGGVYYYAATDKTYLVPSGVNLSPGQQESQISFIIAEGSAAYERQISLNAKIEGSYGAFSGKVKTSFDSVSTEESTSYFAQRSQRVVLWRLWLIAHPAIDCECQKRYEALSSDTTQGMSDADRGAFDSFIEDYGAYVVRRITTGGRIDYNVTVESSKVTSSESLKVDIEASYQSGFSSASVEAGADLAQASDEFQLNAETTIEVHGGKVSEAASLMDEGGSILDWALTIPADPAVVDTQYTPIWEVLDAAERHSAANGGLTTCSESGSATEGGEQSPQSTPTMSSPKVGHIRAAALRRIRREAPQVSLKVESQLPESDSSFELLGGAAEDAEEAFENFEDVTGGAESGAVQEPSFFSTITLGGSHVLRDPAVELSERFAALRVSILDATDLSLLSDQYFYVKDSPASPLYRNDQVRFPPDAQLTKELLQLLGDVAIGEVIIVSTCGDLAAPDGLLLGLLNSIAEELRTMGATEVPGAATQHTKYAFVGVPGSASADRLTSGGVLKVTLADNPSLDQYGLLLRTN